MNPTIGGQEATINSMAGEICSLFVQSPLAPMQIHGEIIFFIEFEYERGIPIRPDDGKYVGTASEGTSA